MDNQMWKMFFKFESLFSKFLRKSINFFWDLSTKNLENQFSWIYKNEWIRQNINYSWMSFERLSINELITNSIV